MASCVCFDFCTRRFFLKVALSAQDEHVFVQHGRCFRLSAPRGHDPNPPNVVDTAYLTRPPTCLAMPHELRFVSIFLPFLAGERIGEDRTGEGRACVFAHSAREYCTVPRLRRKLVGSTVERTHVTHGKPAHSSSASSPAHLVTSSK